MFTSGNPRLSAAQKCPEPVPDLHYFQREVQCVLQNPVMSVGEQTVTTDFMTTTAVSVQYFDVFLTLTSRLLIYGKYCSHVETAIATLDTLCKDREDVRMKLEVKQVDC